MKRLFDVSSILHEIVRVFPTVQHPLKRDAIAAAWEYLIFTSYLRKDVADATITVSIIEQAILFETLRRCGVAPVGWPVSPLPGESLKPFHIGVQEMRSYLEGIV